MKKVISTSKAPAAIGPYSQAIEVGNLVFVSGQIPVDPATGKVEDDVKAQARQSLTNLSNILDEAGLSMENIAKTTVFLADIADFVAVNEVYATFFSGAFPARSAVAVKDLPKGVKLEIEAIASK
jgi:2-iminobutanoate/2-iminopropanoate deaminase